MGDYIVYKYTSPSGGVYIGQTHNSIEYRAGNSQGRMYAILDKTTGEFKQPAIAHAILKYGFDNFQKEIISSGLTSEEADELEKKLIKEAKENGECYNIASGGKGVPGTKEHKVKQFTLSGEYVKTWDSIKEVEAFLNINGAEANIVACCLNRKKRAYGYIWKYEEDNSPVKPQMPYRHPVCQYTKDGEFVAIYSTLKEAFDITGIKETSIGNCLHGRSNSAGGYVWKFSEAPKTYKGQKKCLPL